MAKAEEVLRIKLGNKASKAASRVAAEGVVAIHISGDGKLGAIVEVNSETDFVAKNDDFLAFSRNLATIVATATPMDVPALSAALIDGVSVEETRKASGGQDWREHVDFDVLPAWRQRENWSANIHGGSKIGVLLDVVGGDESMAKDIAMHIAASKPKSLDSSGVPQELLDTERRIAIEKAREGRQA